VLTRQQFCPRFVTMEDREPTVRTREVGDFLRQAMETAGFSGQDMARKLDWSGARVSRLLSGKRGGSDTDVSAFLAVCGVSAKERARLVELTREAQTRGWLQQYGSRLPKQVRTLINHEANAAAISGFAPMLVPGLLQTRAYARASMIEAGTVPEDEIEDRVSARLMRKTLFDRDHPPDFIFYLHEFVLRLPVGGACRDVGPVA
jgi:transcriptional regulator with XRE-family HTH domain